MRTTTTCIYDLAVHVEYDVSPSDPGGPHEPPSELCCDVRHVWLGGLRRIDILAYLSADQVEELVEGLDEMEDR